MKKVNSWLNYGSNSNGRYFREKFTVVMSAVCASAYECLHLRWREQTCTYGMHFFLVNALFCGFATLIMCKWCGEGCQYFGRFHLWVILIKFNFSILNSQTTGYILSFRNLTVGKSCLLSTPSTSIHGSSEEFQLAHSNSYTGTVQRHKIFKIIV